jgi:hypothetical protein
MIIVPLTFSCLIVLVAFVGTAWLRHTRAQGPALSLRSIVPFWWALGPLALCGLVAALVVSGRVYEHTWGSGSPAAQATATAAATALQVSFTDLAQQADRGAFCPECGLHDKLITTTAVVSDASTVSGVYGAPSDVIVSLVPGGAYRGHSHLVCAEAISKVVIQKGQRVHVTGTISDADSPTDQWAGTAFHMDSCTVAPA